VFVPNIRSDLDGGPYYQDLYIPNASAAHLVTSNFGKSHNPFVYMSADCVKTRATENQRVDKQSRAVLLEHRLKASQSSAGPFQRYFEYEDLYFDTVRSAVNLEFLNDTTLKAIFKNEASFDSALTTFIQMCRDIMATLPVGIERTKVDDQRSAIADLKLAKDERKQMGHTWLTLQPLFEDVFAEIQSLRVMCRGHEDGANSVYFDIKLTQYLQMRAISGWKSDRMTELSINAQQKSIRALELKADSRPGPADKQKPPTEKKCPYCTAVHGRPTYGLCHVNFCPHFLKFQKEAEAHKK
jgi:hypothetical protein